MAPIEAGADKSNLPPLMFATTTVLASFAGLFSIIQSFVKLRRSLPVSSRTRSHEVHRRRHVILFAALAALSLVVNVYNGIEWLVDSYKHFVVAHSVVPHTSIWTSPLWLPRYDQINTFKLRAWYDSNEVDKIVAAMLRSPRDFWWFQQLMNASMIWVLFLAIEGRRHQIPRLAVYLFLSTTFGLSVAVNLFFVALLLSPVPYERERAGGGDNSGGLVGQSRQLLRRFRLNAARDRSPTWAPNPALYIVPMSIGIVCTLLMPYSAGQSFSSKLVAFPALPALLVFAFEYTALLPASFGTIHPTVHSAHASYALTFRLASLTAFLVHAVSAFFAIVANGPETLRPRFRLLDTSGTSTFGSHAFGSSSPWTSSAYFQSITSILGAFSDSPFVQTIGWDVILTGLSVVLWAGVRGLHPSHLLSAAGLPVTVEQASSKPKKAQNQVKRAASTVKAKAKSAAAQAENAIRSTAADEGDEDREDTPPITRAMAHGGSTHSSPPSSPPAKSTARSASGAASRRGRKPKPVTDADGDGEDDDAAYQPATSTSKPKDDSGTRSRRGRKPQRPSAAELEEEGEEDTTYQPTAGKESTREREHDEHGEYVDIREQTESASVAWGVLVLGGLGLGLGGVLGAEVV